MTATQCCFSCEPIMVRCDNCKHVLSKEERGWDIDQCPTCKKPICTKCGGNEFKLPLYSWDEYQSRCKKCGEEYG